MLSVAMAFVPTIIRAYSMTLNICAMPSWTSPISQPWAGTPFWPNVISQVVETLRPIFFSTLVTKAPLRSPGLPSASKWYFGTKNRLRPLVPTPPRPSTLAGRARTRWMMFSAMSCSPEVMKRFTPSMCHEPSSWRNAFVVPAPTSDPASGSVRTMVAPHSRSIMIWAHFFCSSLPRPSTIDAKPGPDMYM